MRKVEPVDFADLELAAWVTTKLQEAGWYEHGDDMLMRSEWGGMLCRRCFARSVPGKRFTFHYSPCDQQRVDSEEEIKTWVMRWRDF